MVEERGWWKSRKNEARKWREENDVKKKKKKKEARKTRIEKAGKKKKTLAETDRN